MTWNLQILYLLKDAQSTSQSIADILHLTLPETETLLKLLHRTGLVTKSTSTLTYWHITAAGETHVL